MANHRQEYYNLKENLTKKVWVIAFKDGDTLHYWRNEIYRGGEFMDYGKVRYFLDEEKCKKFMYNETDSHAYDFYITQITKEELDKYEEEMK